MTAERQLSIYRTGYKPIYYSFYFVNEKKEKDGYEDDHDNGDDYESDVK